MKLYRIAKKYGRKAWDSCKKGVVTVVVAAGTAIASIGMTAHSVFAAVPQELTDAFTTVETDSTTVIGYGWALWVIVFGGLILMKIANKAGHKAT